MDWINITLVCEKGHEDVAGAGDAELSAYGDPTFMGTSSWDTCDTCGEARSDVSRRMGYEEIRKILILRRKHQLTIIPDEPNWFEMNVEGMQI